jgi:hypothetical protein
VTVEAMPPLTVKGKDEPIVAHRLLAVGPRRSRLPADRPLSPFVGRERELGVLREALSEVQAGHGQVVIILGEPGVGKSRLLHEFHLALSGRDLAYAEGWCQSFGQAMPYLPWQDILRANFSISETDDGPHARAKVSAGLAHLGLDTMRHAPYLLQLLGLQDGTEALAHLTPETIKGRTLETLLQVALSQARQRPAMLAIEDLHWIDKSSEEVLAALADRLSGVPLLLVTTARPGYAPPWLGKSYAAQLALRVLPHDAARTIVEATVQRSALPSEVTQAIVEKAEGNPLLLEELTLAAAAHDRLEALQALPNTIQGVLAARIDRLPEASIQLLEPLERLFRSASQWVMMPRVEVALGEAYWRAGRRQDARRTLDGAAAYSHRSGMKYWEGYAYRLLGELGIEQEDADALASAEGHFAPALVLFEICGAEPDLARTYAGLGQLRLRQGKVPEAHSALNKALEFSERLGMSGEPERVRQLIERTTPCGHDFSVRSKRNR